MTEPAPAPQRPGPYLSDAAAHLGADWWAVIAVGAITLAAAAGVLPTIPW